MNNKLTRKDIEEMQAEIDHRKLVERPKLLEEVKETRAQGDLSENFEYHVAKRAKNQNESRIRFLERMIKTAKIIEECTRQCRLLLSGRDPQGGRIGRSRGSHSQKLLSELPAAFDSLRRRGCFAINWLKQRLTFTLKSVTL